MAVSQLGPWGHQDPTNWRLEVGQRQALQEITVGHGFAVDRIEFTIVDESGNRFTSRFGGPGGRIDRIVLRSNENITRLSGTHGTYRHDNRQRVISSLRIHTNLNPTGYGPYGQQRDVNNISNFSSPMPLYAKIFGFVGRSGTYLNSIGILVRKTIERHGPWGNQGVTTWNWELNHNETIKEFVIISGYVVDGIGFTVADETGKTSTVHFGGRGGRVEKIVLRSNEQITQLSGTDAEYRHDGNQRVISSLRIHTNLSPNGYGPYGEQKDVSNTSTFSSPIVANDVIVSGLFGRSSSGRFLNSIGMFFIKM